MWKLSIAWSLALPLMGCTARNQAFCDEQTPCLPGRRCNFVLLRCEPIDGGTSEIPVDSTTTPAADGRDDGGDLGADTTRRPLGERCGGNDQCASAHCVDGVCCNAPCSGSCRSCALAGKRGRCELVPQGADPDGECAGDARCGGRCDGQGACAWAFASTVCADAVCVDGRLTSHHCDGAGGCAADPLVDCGGYACTATGDACRTSCRPDEDDCTGTSQCIDGHCVDDLPLGSSCGENDLACASARCTDGVCCAVARCPSCQACGADGQCQPAHGGEVCGAASCAEGTREIPRCQGGSCQPTFAGCDGFACIGDGCRASCEDEDDCVEGYFCNASRSCQSKRELGEACQAPVQCQSGRCTNSVCCDVDDCGPCQACQAGSGSCAALGDGVAPPGHCPGDASCGGDQCLGGQCAYASPGTPCGKNSCAGQTLTVYGCDEAHRCAVRQTPSCAPYRCNAAATACRSECIDASHCDSASLCDRTTAHEDGGGVCIPEAWVAAVASTTHLGLAIDNALGQGRTHLKLTGSSYSGLSLDDPGTAVTLVGVNRPTITPTSDGPAVSIAGAVETPDLFDPLLKLQNVRISGGSGPAGDGVNCVGAEVWIIESLIEQNAHYGVRAEKCGVQLRRSEIRANGGGVWLDDSGHLVVNNLIVNNGACLGALSLLHGACEDPEGLGALTVQRSHHRYVSEIFNNTIADNVATSPAGLSCSNISETPTNNIFWNNDAGGSCPTPQTCTPHETVVGCAPAPDSGDGQLSPTSYRPLSGSSNINGGLSTSGVTVLDKDNVIRPLGSGIDLGCYEVK